jgi:predicted SprT family Zn-dependent metalloprotease
MDRIEMVEVALREVGDVQPEKIAAFVRQRFGVKIEARYIPVFRASIHDQRRMEALKSKRAAQPATPVIRDVAPDSQRASQAQQLAVQLMKTHGLHDWRFQFNRRKETMGLCVYTRRIIELSLHFVERNPIEEIRDTILHEIAHALVGHEHGHDRVWQRKCIEIGARPERCGKAEMPEGKWLAGCASCGKAFHRHRKPRRGRTWFCRGCGQERGKLTWKRAA